ncbi:MAG: glycosyl transferase family 1 [Burkholderiales bacterium]|nr:glycosyl transferase family 1 [Burkholderiales bacterium]
MRILFFAEAVTLAHVARPLALAGALTPGRHEIVIACHPRYAAFADAGPWRRVDLNSIAPAQFTQALARGAPVFDLPTLQAYVAEDRALIAQHRPDVVVGDFRLSLSVSARLAGVPYIAISNAYWCPGYAGGYALPVLPMTRFMPVALASLLFNIARPLAFALHCRPLNRLRRQHGLPGFGNDLRRAYTDADHVLIADDPSLYRVDGPTAMQTAIGSLAWSPPIAPPPWWNEPAPADTPDVYVTLGSSGPRAMLAAALRALAPLPVRVIASSAGAAAPTDLPPNARIAPYLPGDAAAARSRLVICNGGSLTVQQALAVGVPVLGLASNMDQFLNMAPIVAAGAGLTLRADRATPASIRSASQALLSHPAHAAAARALQARMQPDPAIGAKFEAVATRLLAAQDQK